MLKYHNFDKEDEQLELLYNGEKLDYINVNTPDRDNLKFSVEKNKLSGVLVWGNKVSIKSKVRARIFKNGLSIQLIDPHIKAVN